MTAPTLSTIRRAWVNRFVVISTLFPGGRVVWRITDLRIRLQALRLLARTWHAMYQPIPFVEFDDLEPYRVRVLCAQCGVLGLNRQLSHSLQDSGRFIQRAFSGLNE